MLAVMRFLLFLICSLTASAAFGNPFAAAGRLERMDRDGTCSAALIQPTVVATAAHCVGEGDFATLVFRPGNGRMEPPIPVVRALRHPFFDEFEAQRFRRLRFDIALLELASPVPGAAAEPFRVGPEAELGEGLFLVSWRAGEGSRPRQRRCLVIEGEVPGVVTLGCQVRGGESGAPVLRLVPDGVELVAIVSSRSRLGQQPVAIASDVTLRIPPLLQRLGDTP